MEQNFKGFEPDTYRFLMELGFYNEKPFLMRTARAAAVWCRSRCARLQRISSLPRSRWIPDSIRALRPLFRA